MRLPMLALTIVFIGTTAFAQDGTVSLTLKDAIKQAVEKNLDVKTELYNPAQAEADLRKNRAIYETHLTLNTSYQDSTSVATSRVSGNKVKTFEISPGAYRLLPSGGTLSLAYHNYYTDTNSSFATFNR